MAISPTVLLQENNSTDGSGNHVTASVTLTAGRLYILDVVVTRNVGVPPTLTVTSTGATWASLGSNAFNTIAANRTRRQSFRTAVTSDQTGAITIVFSTDRNSISVVLTEYTGTVAVGTDGADAIRQTISGRADASADFSLTFSASATTGDGMHVSWGSDGGSGDTVTLNDGLISLSDQSQTADALRAVSCWLAQSITTFHISGTSRDVAMLGVEIKAEPAGSASNESNLVSPLSISALQITR